MSAEGRYQTALLTMPVPGCGCHTALQGISNLGVMTGRDGNTIFADVKSHIPVGNRRVPDAEIWDAVKKAIREIVPVDSNAPYKRTLPSPRRTRVQRLSDYLTDKEEAQKIQNKLISAGGGEADPFDADVWESSPIQIQPSRLPAFPFAEDGLQLLKVLYKADDVVYIGKVAEPPKSQAGHIKSVAEWINFFEAIFQELQKQPETAQARALAHLADEYAFIVPNPLTGQKGRTKSGSETFKGDDCVKSFKFLVAECDNLPMRKQGALLRGICRELDYKIHALIYSGSRSIHAWLKTGEGISSQSEWKAGVADGDFSILGKLGFDGACKNSSRASRFPGMYRSEKGTFQQLLFLSPEGSAL